jgi:hypothetical protein
VEDIPRRMRVGVTETAEVRLARDRMERIAASLQPRSAAARPTGFITGAVSVRLRAPEGGFSIEAAAPETQWVENTLGLGYDDYATWRWNVTPRRRGKRRLQVLVSARTVRQDGLAAETALPDQVIQVRVRANYARALRRLLLFLLALGAGAGLGKYGEAALELARQMLRTWGKL